MTKKITKTMRFADIAAMLEGKPVRNGTTTADALAFIAHEVELLAKKNNSDAKKPTKVQAENVAHKNAIIAYLTAVDEGVTATQVMTACNLPSSQKAAALLKQLTDSGEVVKETVKGKSLFRLSPDGENTQPDEG